MRNHLRVVDKRVETPADTKPVPWKAGILAIGATLAAVTSVLSIRSATMPFFAAAGTIAGGAALASVEWEPTRQQRKFLDEEKRLKELAESLQHREEKMVRDVESNAATRQREFEALRLKLEVRQAEIERLEAEAIERGTAAGNAEATAARDAVMAEIEAKYTELREFEASLSYESEAIRLQAEEFELARVKWEEESAKLLQQRLADAEAQIQRQNAERLTEISLRWQEVEAERDRLRETAIKLEGIRGDATEQEKAVIAKARAYQEQSIQQWESLKQQKLAEIAAVEAENAARFEGARQKLIADANAEKAEVERIHKGNVAALREREQEWDLKFRSQQAQLANLQQQYKTAIEQAQAKVDESIKNTEEASKYYEQHWRKIYSHVAGETHLLARRLQEPDKTGGASRDELVADKIMDFLKLHDIVVKQPIVKSTNRGFDMEFKVLPLQHEKDNQIMSAGRAVNLIQSKLLNDIKATVPGCVTTPSVEAIYQGVKLSLDTSGIEWEKEAKKDPASTIEERPPEHIFSMFKKSYHLGALGSTGRGKTTFFTNLLGAMSQELQGNGGKGKIRVEVAAGKPDAKLYSFAEFGRLTADYFESLLTLKRAAALVSERIAIQREAFDKRLPLPEFDEKWIFWIDEISELAAMFDNPTEEVAEWLRENDFPKKKPLATLLRTCWRLGRSEGVMILISGQNVMASTLGVNLQDLKNMGMIYLGTSVPEGINAQATVLDRGYLLTQYALRVKAGQEFYGLFCNGGGEVYVAQTPPPGYFAFTGQKTDGISVAGFQRYETAADRQKRETEGVFDATKVLKGLLEEGLLSNSGTKLETEDELEETVQKHENGAVQFNETESLPVKTQKRIQKVKLRISNLENRDNLSVSQIVEKLSGMKPNRGSDYKQWKSDVEIALRIIQQEIGND